MTGSSIEYKGRTIAFVFDKDMRGKRFVAWRFVWDGGTYGAGMYRDSLGIEELQHLIKDAKLFIDDPKIHSQRMQGLYP